MTGASGFLAGYVATAFAEAGAKVDGLDRNLASVSSHPAGPAYVRGMTADLCDTEAWARWIEAAPPDLVVHLAGPADVPASFDDPTGDLRAHLDPLLSLYSVVGQLRAKPRVLMVSSAAVYGQPRQLPTPEEAPRAPISPYGYHKVQQELFVEEFARLHGVPGCSARVFSVYGEGLRHLAFWDITRRALRGDGGIHGTGNESRDYLHAADVGRALVSVASHMPFEGEAVNVASGAETRIADLALRIHRECGVASAAPRDTVGERGKPARWLADVGRLRSTGFAPSVSIDDGIRRTVAWIREQ